MPTDLLTPLLESWDRNNRILVNLLRAVSDADMDLAATPGSPTIAAMFSHLHFCRVYVVNENAPEFARPIPPENEWPTERDPARLEEMLNQSAQLLSEAVKDRVESGLPMARFYDHPILMIQHMLWHDGYHHGQIKLALKAAGRPLNDKEIGLTTWHVWMRKTGSVTRQST